MVQKKVDKTSNVAKLVPLTLNLLPVDEARSQFKRVLAALPRGASTWPSKLLASGTCCPESVNSSYDMVSSDLPTKSHFQQDSIFSSFFTSYFKFSIQ